ncbi:MAG TPA: polysaccharide deacetylase family protein, partial [Aggregatilineaceae bacterium]|nr:polysaccharide deacetylase family protein [Aggregatilineaceae bacterium]
AAFLHVPVLMYHYVSAPPSNADAVRLDLAVTPENFRGQMQYLKDGGYHTITPDMLIAALTRGTALPAKSIMLTFDDGYEDAYANVFPVLKQDGFTGAFFIITGFIDHNLGGYLTWSQVKAMSAAGMSIQDHSMTHQIMVGRDHAWLKTEVEDTRDEIQTHTGIRPVVFCYPMGKFDLNTLLEVQAAGFQMAFTTRGSSYLSSTRMLALPRVRIHGSTTLPKFVALVNWNQ